MKIKAEITIIGGGPAGVCAAITSARKGLKTVLVHDRPVLGGNSSSEIRVWTRGATGGGNLYAEEMGVWGDLKLRNLYTNVEGNPIYWDDVLLELVREEENLILFLNCYITEVSKDGEDSLKSVFGFQMGTEKKIEFESKMFIDATGDGTIGYLCDIPFIMGREGSHEYGETYAPSKQDSNTFGNTILFYTKKQEKPCRYIAPSFAYSMEYIKALLGKGGRIVNEEMNGCDYWWFETGGVDHTIENAQEIMFELKKLVLGVWNYIKNSGEFDAENLTLVWEGNLPGKRESRRMITEYVLRQSDIEQKTSFDDIGFYGGWYLDFHPSDGIFTEQEYCTQIPVQIFGIPLRCLYNKKINNLLFAGRNIGVSHVAFASTRIMNTCALSGQAAATMGYIAISNDTKVTEFSKEEISQVQQNLIRDDMMLPSVLNEDEYDLARKAQISVSSIIEEKKEEIKAVRLERNTFIAIPSVMKNAKINLYASEKTRIEYKIYRSDLPSRLALGENAIETCFIELGQGENQIELKIPKSNKECYFTYLFKNAGNVLLYTWEKSLTGVIGGNQESSRYWSPMVTCDLKKIYGANNLTNGYNRVFQKPNIWISGMEEIPYILLKWNKIQIVREIDLYFNPDLSMELVSSRAESWAEHHKYDSRESMPLQLIKSFKIYQEVENVTGVQYEQIIHVCDNWRRKVKVELPKPIETKGIKIEITETYGQKNAEVFEVRVY